MSSTYAQERQITFSPKQHCLDNNDNFSSDGRFLCYDTRETKEPPIGHCTSIEKVEIATGQETVLYKTEPGTIKDEPYPGVGAVSFSPVEDKVIFIHGPLKEDAEKHGPYAKNHRTGAEVAADGSGAISWPDKRDVETSRDTLPGAHRGGTHRHEYSADGKRIGFTYDDFLLPQYQRTIAYMEKNPKAPQGATHYFAILVPVVPKGTAKPGELETALGDSWVGRNGTMRAFVGTIREEDGSYKDSLFVVDIPPDVDITTADSGSATRFPAPPKGLRIRRLTHNNVTGIARGSLDGTRIAYCVKDKDGHSQVFMIPSDGSDQDPDPAKWPVQVSNFPQGADSGPRWHPSGDYLVCVSNKGIAVITVKPGADFGKTVFITPQGDNTRKDIVISPDGTRVAYTLPIPGNGTSESHAQIFVVSLSTPFRAE